MTKKKHYKAVVLRVVFLGSDCDIKIFDTGNIN